MEQIKASREMKPEVPEAEVKEVKIEETEEKPNEQELFEIRKDVVEKTLDAIKEFCDDYDVVIEPQHLELFRKALMQKGGYFQWTPMAQAFKRITIKSPSEMSKRHGMWNGELAFVVAPFGDSVDENLTQDLNARIEAATENAWQNNPDL